MFKMTVQIEAQANKMTCWHAAAMMLWIHSQQKTGRQGPMNTLSAKWANNEVIFPKEFINLAMKVGLMPVHRSGATYTPAQLETLMRKWGPLWCAGQWYGVGHIIVLTGIVKNTIYINDPDQGKKKTATVDWFNAKLDNQLAGAILVKDPKAY